MCVICVVNSGLVRREQEEVAAAPLRSVRTLRTWIWLSHLISSRLISSPPDSLSRIAEDVIIIAKLTPIGSQQAAGCSRRGDYNPREPQRGRDARCGLLLQSARILIDCIIELFSCSIALYTCSIHVTHEPSAGPPLKLHCIIQHEHECSTRLSVLFNFCSDSHHCKRRNEEAAKSTRENSPVRLSRIEGRRQVTRAERLIRTEPRI